MLTFVDGTSRFPSGLFRANVKSRRTDPAGLKELINIIVSNISDTEVLGEGREAWMASIGFSSNCAGVVAENQHRADLGDGNGQKNETDIKRCMYNALMHTDQTHNFRLGNYGSQCSLTALGCEFD